MFYVAFQMLVGDRGKFIGIILGLSFASLIMTQQPGIFVGLLTRTFSLITDIALPDLWVMDPKIQYIDDNKPLPTTGLYRVASVEGVAWAKPLYRGIVEVQTRSGASQNSILIGIDDTTLIGGPPHILKGDLRDLRETDSIFINQEGAYDKFALPSPTAGKPKIPLPLGSVFEINDRRAVVVGIVKTTRAFFSYPVLYTTYTRALSYAPPQRNMLSFILVKAKSTAALPELQARIERQTGLKAYTAQEFKKLTILYYLKNTGIPINFGVSVLLGFLVGAAITGQTFYTFTLENLKYFGVLKAMGTSQKTLLSMILFQALLSTFIGYGLGVGGTAIFALFSRNSAIAFDFPKELFAFSLSGVLLISLFSAFISIQKVLKLEAAIVFKG